MRCLVLVRTDYRLFFPGKSRSLKITPDDDMIAVVDGRTQIPKRTFQCMQALVPVLPEYTEPFPVPE
jgi:hypothetical protein